MGPTLLPGCIWQHPQTFCSWGHLALLLVSRGQRPGVLLNCPQRRPHDENDLLPNASRPRQRALLHRDLRARRPRRWPGSPGRGQRLGSAGRGPDSQPCSAPEITASLRAAVSTGLSLHPLLATCGSHFDLFGGTIRAPMCPPHPCSPHTWLRLCKQSPS